MKVLLFYLLHGKHVQAGTRHALDERGVLWHILARSAWSG